MLKNYLKIALRSLAKQKIYSFINVLGLSIGIASCFLITLYVTDEFSFDKFHEKADQIYKVVLERKYPNHSTNYAVIPHSYADVLPQDFPEISEVVKISDNINNVLVRYEAKGEEKRFEENFIMAADSNFFNVFSIPILKGDPGKALLNNTDLVLTESTSKRYFAKEEPVGKTLNLLGRDFTVTAVCADVPENSHFKFDFLARWDENVFGGGRRINFTSFSAHVYVVVKPGTDPKVLEEKFPEMVDTYAAAQIEQDLGKSWADYKKEGNGYRYFLQPLTGIHLDPTNIEAKMRPGGNKNYVYFLISVAILILVIACINFMNLATARSSERAREVGVRKTMGSAKSQLVLQFLTESILLSIFSTLLAIVIIYFALPSFNNLAGKQLEFTITINRIAALGIIALSVGCLAGSYPAFVLSAFNPVTVMKGNFSGSTKSAWLRNGLVVFQFFISIVLIIGTLVVSDQMKYMQNKSLGYDKDRILVIERAFALGNNRESFLEETKRIPNVINASTAQQLLGEERNFFGAQWKAQGSSEILTTKSMVIDDHFASTIGFNFVEGKGYSKETNDSLYVILNESAVKTLELTDPIGKKLSQVQRTPNGNVTVEYTIIGVIKDFNFQSLRDAITPLTIQSSESFGGGGAYAYLKLSGDHFASTVALVEAHWKKIPEEPFKYLFFDQNLRPNTKTKNVLVRSSAYFQGWRSSSLVSDSLAGGLHRKFEDEGNWSTKSIRRNRGKCCSAFIHGVHQTYSFRLYSCCTFCLVYHGQLASGICIQNRTWARCFFTCRNYCLIYFVDHCELSVHQGSNRESG
jgi:putative ABC transport system permease protein